MAQIILGPNRAYPSIPTVGNDLESHSRALEAIVEALQIHERRTGDTLDSFVRVGELEILGLANIDGRIVTDVSVEESTTHHHDGTYLRLDGTNDPVTGAVSFTGGLSATGLTASNPTFTGTIDVSGGTFTGLSSDDLSDVTSIAMLDEDEIVLNTWDFSAGLTVSADSINMEAATEIVFEHISDPARTVTFGLTGMSNVFETTFTATPNGWDLIDLDMLKLRDGAILYMYDAADTDYLALYDTGAVSFIQSSVNPIQLKTGGAYVAVIDGKEFRVYDGTNTDHADFYHDGADFYTDFTTTADWYIDGLTGDIRIGANSAIDVELYGEARLTYYNADVSAGIFHRVQGQVAASTGVNLTDWDINSVGNFNINDGALLRIKDSTDTDYAQLAHDGTDFNLSFVTTAQFNISGVDVVEFADDTGLYWNNLELVEYKPADGDASYSNVQVLCNFDGVDAATSHTEQSTNAASVSFVNSAQLDTAQKKFGSASLLLSKATNDYVTVPDNSAFTIGTSDFTVEAWVRFATLPSSSSDSGYCVASHYDNAGNQRAWYLAFNTSDQIQFLWSINGSATQQINSSDAPTLSTGVWYHVAVSRNGANLRIFLDGVELSVSGDSISGDSIHDPGEALHIGDLQSSAGSRRWFDGWIDDFRFTVGTSRYNAGFTPPTTAHDSSGSTDVTFVLGDSSIDLTVDALTVLINGDAAIRGGNDFLLYDSTNSDYLRFTHSGSTVDITGFQTTTIDFKDLNGIKIRDGGYLRIQDSTDTDYLQMSHGGTNFDFAFTNTTHINWTGFTGSFWLRDGINLRISDSTDSDWGQFSHDGTDFVSTFTNTADWRVEGLSRFELRSGGDLLVYGPGNSVFGTLSHSDTNLALTSSGTSNIQIGAGSGLVNIISGNTFRIWDTANTDRAELSHDGSIFHYNHINTDSIVFETGGADRFTVDFTNDRIISYSPLFMEEQAAANADTAGFGQFWVKTETPNSAWFTDDAGNDRQLTYIQISTTTALEAVGNAINTAPAKVAGFMVFNTTTGAPVWAAGSADGDVWVDATGATVTGSVGSVGGVCFRGAR